MFFSYLCGETDSLYIYRFSVAFLSRHLKRGQVLIFGGIEGDVLILCELLGRSVYLYCTAVAYDECM